jgi:hypothetical protein
MSDRLAALEAQAATLAAEIAALKAGRPVAPPPPPKDEGVRVVEVLDERRGDLPTLAELKKLFAVVRHRVPEQKSHDPDAAFRGFCGAVRYIANCGRIATPNSKYALGWWLDDMIFWLRARNAMTIDISGASFIAAVIASGDVLYVPHDSTMGFVWEFGIMPPNHGGKPADAGGWRRVLDGSILSPSAPARRSPAPSQVRVYGG